MEHRVRTGTARGTLMKRVPLKHTEDGQCMSSSGAWTSVPASHQASSLHTPLNSPSTPRETHSWHRAHQATPLQLQLLPVSLRMKRTWAPPALQDNLFMSLTWCSATLTEIFHTSVKLSDFWASAQASPSSVPSVLLYGFWTILRSSAQASQLMKMSINHINSSCLCAQSISCVQWTSDPMDL